MKKVILLYCITLLITKQLAAQQWVSTAPENKKVVLEMFSGIHNGYDPDADKRANDIQVSNSGKVILVKIHSGGFADPAPGEPDLRISEGEVIDGAADISGYPAGTVNRIVPSSPQKPGGIAMGRQNWSSEASKILIQQSPVNVAVKAFLDVATRELTVETELYYTSNSASPINYLTIMLLQDNILGPQNDFGNYNPANWITVEGERLYKHDNVLRMVLTETFGDTIDTTSQGHYAYKKYTQILPEKINGVDLKFSNLKVVAFVSESQNNIYNGEVGKVEFDSNYIADLAIASNLTKAASDLCDTVIHPIVEITNVHDAEIHSFEITATIEDSSYIKTFKGVLKKGEKDTIDFGLIGLQKGGNYTVSFSGFKKVNQDSLFDIDELNNHSFVEAMAFRDSAITELDGHFDGIVPDHFGLDQSNNDKFNPYVVSTKSIGANNSTGAILFYIHNSWGVAGKPGSILFGEYVVPSAARLLYYYAYSDKGNGSATGAYGGTPPVIVVEATQDCGATWDTLNVTTLTETGMPLSNNALYLPVSNEYISVATSLDSLAGEEIIFRISGIPGTHGNAFYIDEIGLDIVTDVHKMSGPLADMNLYPNPSNGTSYLQFNLDKQATVSVDVYNMVGQKVQTVMTNESLSLGDQRLEINTNGLAAGMYNVTLTTEAGVQTQSLQVVK